MTTTEEKTAHILNDTPEEVTIGGRTYTITPPTFVKLAQISAEIARLESDPIDPERLAQDVLRVAGSGKQIARIIATMIDHTKLKPKPWYKRLFSRREDFASFIYRHLTPQEANEVLSLALGTLQLGDFFGLTTFLSGVNITKPTKVDNETTALGH